MKKYLTGMVCLSALVVTSFVGCMSSGEQSAESMPPMDGPYESGAAADSPEMAMPEAAGGGEQYSTIKVYYGTNRKANYFQANSSSLPPDDYYGTEFWRNLFYGSCEVSIPDSHEYGEVERPSIWKFEFREDPEKHIVLQSVSPAPAETTLAEIASDVRESQERQAFVFIHGYNVTFAQAARRTAQMAFDLKFDGPPIFFSWPSAGRMSAYQRDGEAAEASAQYLQQFLEQVATQTGASEIHLIAHSMGNRVLAGALDSMSQFPGVNPPPKFNEILLAAPDLDAERFKTEIAPRILDRADRMTIYASDNDKALQASATYNFGRRLGQGGDELTLFPPELHKINMVDASRIDFSWFELGHSAYGNELLEDVRLTLAGVPADHRQLKPHRSDMAWIFRPGSGIQPVNYSEEGPGDIEMPVEEKSWWQRLVWWW